MQSSQEHTHLSTKPYRGTRDFYPELQRQRTALFMSWRRVLSSFGFEEYDSPLLEPLELYAAKSSEEIVSGQLYSFTDRGDRKVALRPEMTPSLARMVAARVRELPRPIRWFSIPRCMRYERPQRGRLREFDQLNVDVFGGLEADEDLEVLSCCVELMQGLGAGSDHYRIRLNDRRVMNSLLETCPGLQPSQFSSALQLLDKKDKLPPEAFLESWEKLCGSPTADPAITEFLQMFEMEPTSPEGAEKQRLAVSARLSNNPSGREHFRSLQNTLSSLQALYPSVQVVHDLSIARGFDYYTGLVFEIFDTHPDNRRALFGGGRYENLVGSFVKDALPGVGFGVSDVALLNFCEAHGLDLVGPKSVEVAVVRFSQEDRQAAHALGAELRRLGLRVSQALTGQKFGKQVQAAERLGARCVVFRGEEELKNESFCVKWLATGEQESFQLQAPGLQAFAEKISRQAVEPKSTGKSV